MEGIIAAIITGVLALAGTVVTVLSVNRNTLNSIKTSQAVMETKIEDLTREVRKHNNFAERMPVIDEQMKTVFKILDRLEAQNNDGK